MSSDWLPEEDVTTRLNVTPRVLSRWRADGGKAIRELLGRTIRWQRPEGSPGFSYWWRDVATIEKALKPCDEFTDGRGTWLPWHQVRVNYRRLWLAAPTWRKGGCPLLPKERPLAAERFLSHYTGPTGIRYRWFYLKEDLDAIAKAFQGAGFESGRRDADLLTKREAVTEFNTSLATLSKLLAAGTIDRYSEVRLARQRHSGKAKWLPKRLTLVSRSQLAEALSYRQIEQRPGPRLILPSDVVELTRGAFKLKTMEYWERRDGQDDGPACPCLGRPLTVVHAPTSIVVRRQGRLVRRGRPEAKHYVYDEIREAFRNYRKAQRKPLKGLTSTRGVLRVNGGDYYTARAAQREHRCWQRQLETWLAKGLIDAEQRARTDMGYRQGTTYYRADGERGFLRMMELRKGRRGPLPKSRDVELRGSSGPTDAAPAVDSRESERFRSGELERMPDPPPYPVVIVNTSDNPAFFRLAPLPGQDDDPGEDRRPDQPTKSYCLPRLNTIRWEREAEVEPRLWHLLGCLLDCRKFPVSFDQIEDAIHRGKDRPSKRLQNDISKLSVALESINFPWIYTTKGAHVCLDRRTEHHA